MKFRRHGRITDQQLINRLDLKCSCGKNATGFMSGHPICFECANRMRSTVIANVSVKGQSKLPWLVAAILFGTLVLISVVNLVIDLCSWLYYR